MEPGIADGFGRMTDTCMKSFVPGKSSLRRKQRSACAAGTSRTEHRGKAGHRGKSRFRHIRELPACAGSFFRLETLLPEAGILVAIHRAPCYTKNESKLREAGAIKRHIFSAVRLVAIFAATLFGLWLLLFCSTLIPNAALRSNMERSALSYAQREGFEFTQGDRLNAVADHYADAIWLNIAWNMGIGNPLVSSIQTEYYDGGELGENAGLYYTVTEGTAPNTDYTRYWHGTAAFIRILHLFTDVEGVKRIGFVSFLLLTAVSAGLLIKLRHGDLAVLLVLALAFVQIWNIRLSMEYQPAFLVAFALLPFYLLLEKRGNRCLTSLSVIGGAAVAFFDFLTTETVVLLLPLILVIAIRARENRLGSFRDNLPLLIRCAAGWCGAYAGAFALKWLSASLVTGTNVFASALSAAEVRVLGGSMPEIAASDLPEHFFSGIFANLTVLFGGTARLDYTRVFLGLALTFLALFSLWYLLRTKETQPAASALVFCLGGVVFVRFLFLNNHSYLHEFFVYRALVSPVMAVFTALRMNVSLPRSKKRRRKT